MAIKMRYLYFSKKKKMAAIGEAVKAKYELSVNAVDTIPSAYSCDKERIVIMAVSAKGSIPDALRLFTREMTKARAQNTCLLMDGDQKAADLIISTLKEAGTNVVGETLFINGGNLFATKPSAEELNTVYAWIDKNISELK